MARKFAYVSADFTTLRGRVVRIAVTCEPDGGERLTVSGINCDLDGDEPGSYLLVNESA